MSCAGELLTIFSVYAGYKILEIRFEGRNWKWVRSQSGRMGSCARPGHDKQIYVALSQPAAAWVGVAYLVGSCVCLATGGRIVVESVVVVEGNLFGP
jgi:hypothetical protein